MAPNSIHCHHMKATVEGKVACQVTLEDGEGDMERVREGLEEVGGGQGREESV